ncbi:hypothetical protein N799_11775 [Lysobacter arseniciresistens ZS79]|uniref:DUF3667 domain-containing protein n=1 Tax=Lysobacter arseniciresistens ZS79 TaxID=913325 RepID=A0A0A0EWC6_9GAMM|nr:DUF3667 domain-containing protein [Lysobacter arseniciresistens]KGM53437.1 hypothetical protein N799_11775 [Lysobacter arseniciresistens ZS79]
MTDHPTGSASHAPPTLCENCHATLQGEFCHQCGQSVHNPIRHAGHAIEEFFEAFWHLDGRLWRTLRDLMVPGRVATNYLAGHRQRYIAPLRLFVVLSVLTFFLGALTIHFDSTTTIDTGVETAAITEAQTVEAVERERDRLLAEVAAAHAGAANIPGVSPALIAAEVKIRGEAANRIAELRQASGDPAAADTPPAAAPAPIPGKGELFSLETFDPERNKVEISWLPGFANDWLTARVGDANSNIQRMEGRPDLWFKAFMASVPSALFVLVPVFALLLKVAYLFTRRLYLEHLVVALYSHAFLLIALAAMFLLAALGGWLEARVAWLAAGAHLAVWAVGLWMPVYLWRMQKRVYAQGWALTTLKYVVIGIVYVYLLAIAAALMFLARLAQG